MDFNDLVEIYERFKEKYKDKTYKHISELFISAKEKHKADFTGTDHEQSWRSFKGKNLERLIEYVIADEVRAVGFEIINGNKLERAINLPKETEKIKRNLLINYGEFGYYLPDVDIVIYNPKNFEIAAVLSVKTTLRERIAQTAYWKIKLFSQRHTKHIQVYFVFDDEAGTLSRKNHAHKGRAIAEIDLDGSYVLSETVIDESGKVKSFDKLIADIKKLHK